MHDTHPTPEQSTRIWLAATLAAGEIVYLPPARPSANQPGTLAQQWEIIDLVAADPSARFDFEAAFQAARKLVLPHARRGAT